MVRTLTTWAQLYMYVTNAEDRRAELSHVRNALQANNYKEWALDAPPARYKKPAVTDLHCGTIYHIMCDDDTHHIYIGETERPLCQRSYQQTL